MAILIDIGVRFCVGDIKDRILYRAIITSGCFLSFHFHSAPPPFFFWGCKTAKEWLFLLRHVRNNFLLSTDETKDCYDDLLVFLPALVTLLGIYVAVNIAFAYFARYKVNNLLNPLWGHCQEYKIEKNAILQEHLLSEKQSTFVYYNLTLSESICFADHQKQIQKFMAHWKVCQKSSQREVIRKNAYKAPKPQGV